MNLYIMLYKSFEKAKSNYFYIAKHVSFKIYKNKQLKYFFLI